MSRLLWFIFKRKSLLLSFILLATLISAVNHLLRTKPSPYPTKPRQEEYVDRRGIRVIVGHYVEEQSKPNFTKSELNLNRYSPVPGAGENGTPVILKNHQLVLSKRLFALNEFNLVASDAISVDRQLADVRSPDCQSLVYDDQHLDDTSVIIVFHNEAWSTLVRTVHSVINNTPNHLIREIILVDDASDREYLKGELEKELSSLRVVSTVLRSHRRIGLIQARLMGAKAAKGKVLTFLDAHCECTPGWLQPILHRIRESPTSVVCPVIDILNEDTFQYTKSFSLHWGAFNWELHFRWFTVGAEQIQQRRENSTRPYATPVMAGGLFSVLADYFWSVGSYDEEMDIWGGENLEMSFRVWQCGGRVEIAPCSRVGHVFRKASPYTFPREGGVGAVLHGNLARLAKTWMDDYAKFYFKLNSQARKASESEDVSKRLELRQKLNCKSFDWYLDNIWPQNFMPRPGNFFGKLRNVKVGKCLQKPRGAPGSQSSQPVGAAGLDDCVDAGFYNHQMFTLNMAGYLMGDESVCLDAPQWKETDAGVRFTACSEIERQQWIFSDLGRSLVSVIHRLSGLCLSVSSGGTSDVLILSKCSKDVSEQWAVEPLDWGT